MKAIKFFAISAMAAAMITSCSSEDELSQSNYPSDNIVRVTAGVNNAKTRAEGQGTPLEKPLSLTVVNTRTPLWLKNIPMLIRCSQRMIMELGTAQRHCFGRKTRNP